MGPLHVWRGVHYRSVSFYSILDWLKRGPDQNKRFQIASGHIQPLMSVLDICAGTGRLKRFIPDSCAYTAIEASPAFCEHLAKQSVPCVRHDLHHGWPSHLSGVDIGVMLISLAQFRQTSIHDLLEGIKESVNRMVIVEEVLSKPRPEKSFIQKTANYLCASDYYVPVTSWFTAREFTDIVTQHGYSCSKLQNRYMTATWKRN